MKTYRYLRTNFLIILFTDALLLASALYLAYLIRFDFNLSHAYLHSFIIIFPPAIFLKIGSFYFFDLYRGMWRYTSISDLFNVIKASSISTVGIIAAILMSNRFIGFSRSVFLIDWCLTILFISGFRIIVRIYFEQCRDQSPYETFSVILGKILEPNDESKKLLIIGAGDCGEKIYREIRDNAHLKYRVVGFLDDQKSKIGRKLHGIPVLGSVDELKRVGRKTGADEALIAIPSASTEQMRHIVNICNESGLDFKTIPSLGELINGKLTVGAIRQVAYSDLLGREIVHLDEERIADYIKGGRVLVTGAGGSIGSELCRQICCFKPQSLILYDRAESPLYEIELELKKNFPDTSIIPVLADILNIHQLDTTLARHAPHAIFHAAAYKHVPMLELQPWKAVENNIRGTWNVIETAREHKIRRVVFVSTDKAVRPTNVMGASKRVAELLINCMRGDCERDASRFMIVRFGNVVGSVGSVVPLFKKQIENGGPLTVTHPDVTRFFMTIPEACQLILQAGAMGKGGEIFLLDMGIPVRIDDMARDLIRLSGFEPDVDIMIEYIGLRPGEKLYEELITEGEDVVPTSHRKIMVLKGGNGKLDSLKNQIDELLELAEKQDSDSIKLKLREIVPEYVPELKQIGTAEKEGKGKVILLNDIRENWSA